MDTLGASYAHVISPNTPNRTMAKPATQAIKMVSSEGTGYFYVAKKNTRTKTEKLEFRKYDPKLRRHVMFKEQRMK